VAPRGAEGLRFPTDLLGVTPAEYDADRQDGNLVAALGPPCSRIKRAIEKQGHFVAARGTGDTPAVEMPPPITDERDIRAILTSWMGGRPSGQNTRVIRFRDVDRELNLPAGSAEKYLIEVATRWNYKPAQRGPETVLFEDAGRSGIRVGRSPWG